MKNFRAFGRLSLLLGLGSSVSAAFALDDGPRSYPDLADSAESRPFALVGDLQRTSFWERYFLGRERNDEEQKQLLGFLAKENIGLLVVLGDMVFLGSDEDHWKHFDSVMDVFPKTLPVLPVIGNHDLWKSGGVDPFRNLIPRFPQLSRSRWYARTYGAVGLIWLDSNKDSVPVEEWREEVSWYSQTLREMESSPKISYVLVFTHHPPFTNSTVTGDEEEIQKAFLPGFLAAKKTVAFVSGHAHAYERFNLTGKTLLVSGGGGGPRVKLLETEKRRHPDLFIGGSPRPFHYLLAEQKPDHLKISVKGFDKGETALRTIDQFELRASGPLPVPR